MKINNKYFNRTRLFVLCLFAIMLVQLSCQKNWLDIKPDSHLAILSTLSDFQSLMDKRDINITNNLDEIGSDDYYVDESGFSYLYAFDINSYVWAPNGYGVPVIGTWEGLYSNIFAINTVLGGLKKIAKDGNNAAQFNQVLGTALFWRGYAYFELAQAFIKPYDAATASTDPGVPLRLEADVAQKIGRGTAQQIYDQVFTDLTSALPLLPTSAQTYKTRPTQGAVYAMLARAYLSVSNYAKAFAYADTALKFNHQLLDYNGITVRTGVVMPKFNVNPEVIFYSWTSSTVLSVYFTEVDSSLYRSYSVNDLRKVLLFTSSIPYTQVAGHSFIGTYNGASISELFSAPAVDELYLIRAECYARAGNVPDAMKDLNTLLINRWKAGTFVPYTATDSSNALTQILTEKRKELVMRGTRWTDLRRLNNDPRFAVTITRFYKGNTYTLLPHDNKYVWPIPDDEILYSGIEQNPR